MTVRVREYAESEAVFVPAAKYWPPHGEISFSIARQPNALARCDGRCPKEFVRLMESSIDKSLLPVVSESHYAPRSLRQIFVEPPLSESRPMEQNVKYVSIQEIVSETTSLCIIGRPESGRTTLLHYIALASNDARPDNLPILINCRDIPKDGLNKVYRAAQDALVAQGIHTNLKETLASGAVTLLIDDLDPKNDTILDALRAFIQEYPKVKIVFSVEHDPLSEIDDVQLLYRLTFS
ncbi:MAG TPA: hypothetical protein GX510_03375 [Firmicutes bacterium]|nr:hypothetical protein [Candidatus Fermentithermobacillaceae bacterium]